MENPGQSQPCDGIAVVGMAGRFPGARNLDEFWRNVRDGVECITFFSEDELLAAGLPAELVKNPNYVKAGTVLEDYDKFDPRFFDYTSREAEIMDPQHRLFLECAWESLEHAGYDPAQYTGAIGVFAGSTWSQYYLGLHADPALRDSLDPMEILFGNDKDFLATKVSYKLNLKGPSITVQTACSTSLVAANMACQSLYDYQCDLALAGGVSVAALPPRGYIYQESGISSPDGHCRAFASRGAGTISGQGVGVVVLKRLEDAISDGDTIHAVVKGWAINNDGSRKVGYTAPSLEGQARVVTEAQAMADFPPDTITYIEAHGTGTNLGDPVEIAALTQAFRMGTSERGYCAIGSVKTNIGHCDAAAGVAGMLKTVMALKTKVLPPSLHFDQPNPKCDFDNSPFFVNTIAKNWTDERGPRRAGVSSFGIGGTNAHMVLEEAPPPAPGEPARQIQILTLSAQTDDALDILTQHLAGYLDSHPEVSLGDVAYTLQLGRRAFNQRRAIVCGQMDDAVKVLNTSPPGRVVSGLQEIQDRAVAFMFTGQGAQRVGMAAEIYAGEPVFRGWVDRCAAFLERDLGLDVRRVLFAGEEDSAAAEKLDQTWMTQPGLFILEYALAQLWQHWGVNPRAMIGHSIGEYVAACLADVFSLEDALTLVCMRGRLMQESPAGKMLAISMPEPEVRPHLGAGLDLAAVNGPEACVVSGPPDPITELQLQLEARGIDCRLLQTSHAFHSRMMDAIIDPYLECVGRLELHAPRLPFVSNVTGTWITNDQAQDPRYWAVHLRQTVRFQVGIEELAKDRHQVLLEVGPGTALTHLATSCTSSNRAVVASLPGRHQTQSEAEVLLLALGKLWTLGVSVDWTAFQGGPRRRVPLPTYPFQRQSYHFTVPQGRADTPQVVQEAPDRGQEGANDWVALPVWKRAPLPPATVSRQQSRGRIIAFVDDPGFAESLTNGLRDRGRDVVTVVPGPGFSKVGSSAYTVSPALPEDYVSLIQDLMAETMPPDVILHAWSVTGERNDHGNSFDADQERGFYSLLYLGKALLSQSIAREIDVLVLSDGMQAAGAEDLKDPEKASLLGPCRVLSQEHPNIRCRSIDIIVPPRDSWRERVLIEQLMGEIVAGPPDSVLDSAVAYRGHDRLVQSLDVVPPAEVPGESARLRSRGVYLITGGLGNLGLLFAHYLAEKVQARLVLVGRAGLPRREEWDKWLASHTVDDPTSARIQIVRQIESSGAETMIISADVSDREQMEDVLRAIDERYGALDGVIHGAGILTGSSIRSIEGIAPADCELQFAPKARGIYVLDSLLADRELDFCLLMSSLSAVVGGSHLVAYSAANSFMDAYVQHHNCQHAVPWISVDWDVAGLTPGQILQIFQRILGMGPVPQVVVSKGDLTRRIEQLVSLDFEEGEDRLEPSGTYPRPAIDTLYVAPRNDTESRLAGIWATLLRLQQVGINDDFFELGGHSLLGVRLMSRVRDTFQVRLSLETLFGGPTVAELAAAITEQKLAHADNATLQRLLEDLEGMTEEEVLATLAETTEGDGAGSH